MNMKHFLRATITMLSLAFAVEAKAQCVGDINADGRVDGGDLGTALAWWGPVVPTNPVSVACDLDNSGRIDGADLGLLLSNWGVCVGSISSVSPHEGCASGGTTITITGTYLGTTSSVTVGGIPCTGVVVRSGTQVEAVVPPGTAGTSEVRVITSAGVALSSQSFSYTAPRASSVEPSQGCVIGGTTITINGECLAGTTGITIGGAPCTNVVVVSSTRVTATTPAGPAGPAEVRVVAGTSATGLEQGFVFMPPSVSSILPNVGSVVGGTAVTITGAYLGLTSTVRIGGAEAANVVAVDASTVTAVSPPGLNGPADVELSGPKGTLVIPGAYRYVAPSISSIAPSIGPSIGGTRITISGTWLGRVNSVLVGGVPATNVVVVSATEVTARTPAGQVGAADVVVAGDDGSAIAVAGFAYQTLVVPSWATLVEAQPDPAVVTDPALRAAIVATGLAWRVRDKGTQIEMLLVPPGTFQMGCTMPTGQINFPFYYGCHGAELPVHQVTLTNAFYMGRYEVTQAQWTAKMGSNPSYWQSGGPRPVEQVSWNMVQGYLGTTGMRLPTEAEWEYACRAGTQTPFYNGSASPYDIDLLAWWARSNPAYTQPGGGKSANGFGLYDMLGNVWEWVSDGYGAYSSVAQMDPIGQSASPYHVIRGGSWYDDCDFIRSSSRSIDPPGGCMCQVGFRVARNP